MTPDDLERQLAFLREIDRLKSIERQSTILDRSRRENSAEHSWHLAMYAWVLAGSAGGTIDVARVVRMLLLHDIVEIDAGDNPMHGGGGATQAEDEARAAERIFGLLPDAQAREMRALWNEFEAGESDDARFAKALDRLQPLVVNVVTGGGTWALNRVQYEDVLARYRPVIERGAPALWAVAQRWAAEHFGRAAEGSR
jgi:putative hydrolase of HD superfamily